MPRCHAVPTQGPIGAANALPSRVSLMERSAHEPTDAHPSEPPAAAIILFTSLEGFFVQNFASASLGRSVHTNSGITAILLIAFGLMWPRLAHGVLASRIAFWCLAYSSLAIIVAFVLAALGRAGDTVMPIAAGDARGTAAQEPIIWWLPIRRRQPGSLRSRWCCADCGWGQRICFDDRFATAAHRTSTEYLSALPLIVGFDQ